MGLSSPYRLTYVIKITQVIAAGSLYCPFNNAPERCAYAIRHYTLLLKCLKMASEPSDNCENRTHAHPGKAALSNYAKLSYKDNYQISRVQVDQAQREYLATFRQGKLELNLKSSQFLTKPLQIQGFQYFLMTIPFLVRTVTFFRVYLPTSSLLIQRIVRQTFDMWQDPPLSIESG